MFKPQSVTERIFFGLRVIAARTFSIISGVRTVLLPRPVLRLHADTVNLKELTDLILVRTSVTPP